MIARNATRVSEGRTLHRTIGPLADPREVAALPAKAVRRRGCYAYRMMREPVPAAAYAEYPVLSRRAVLEAVDDFLSRVDD